MKSLPGAPSPTARTLISSTNLYLIGIALFALMLVGTFSDYAISLTLYTPDSTFALFFAAYGEFPLFLALGSSGTLFLMGWDGQRRFIGYVEIGGGTALLAVAVAGGIMIPGENLAWPFLARTIISLTLIGGVAYLTYLAARTASRQTIIKVAVAFVAIAFLEVLVVSVLKVLWERPRMRMISSLSDGTWFMPWYSPGFAEKDAFLALGVDSGEFKSFPSGHSANAAMAMTATAFAAFPPLRDKATWLLWGGFTYTLVVMFSRIIAGAHYLTDTVVGAGITFVAMVIAYQVLFPPHKGRHSNIAG